MFARHPIFFLAVLSMAAPAFADSAKSLGKSGDWESFTYTDKAGKVCYTASQPRRSISAPKGRGETYVTVTNRVADKSVGIISVTEGFAYKKDSTAELDIGGAKFDLYFNGDTAWTRNDKAVVQAMLKGKSLVAYGTPAKGDQAVDTYSLDGFVKAYATIGQACAIK